MTARLYVGSDHEGFRHVFKSDNVPTVKTHGAKFRYCIGPFVTLRGAEFMASYGCNNLHVQTVADAERLAKVVDMKMLGIIK